MNNERRLLTPGEAAKLIRGAKKTKFCLHVRVDTPIAGDESRVFPGGLYSYLRISREEALRLVSEGVSPTLEARGARIPIALSDSGETRTIWIG